MESGVGGWGWSGIGWNFQGRGGVFQVVNGVGMVPLRVEPCGEENFARGRVEMAGLFGVDG